MFSHYKVPTGEEFVRRELCDMPVSECEVWKQAVIVGDVFSVCRP